MNATIISFLMVLSVALIDPINKIAEINKAKKAARAAIHHANYQEAIKYYQYLTDSLGVEDENIHFNLANAHFQAKDSLAAMLSYQRAFDLSIDNELKADAKNQMGILAHKMGQSKDALEMFKSALRHNPAHADARYNYELLKKLIDEQEQQQQDQDQNQEQNEDQSGDEENQDDQGQGENDEQQEGENDEQQEGDQEQQGDEQQEKGDQQEGENKEQQEQEGDQQEQEQEQQGGEETEEGDDDKKDQLNPSIADKLKEMNMSEEKAQMILEAMRNAEAQYLQQLKKKPTKKADPKLPDW